MNHIYCTDDNYTTPENLKMPYDAAVWAQVSEDLKKLQESEKARLEAAFWKIKDVETKFAALSLDEQRNVHLQGAKARFLLAGAVQHRPSAHKFGDDWQKGLHIIQKGPFELCPVIDIWEDARIAQRIMASWLKASKDESCLNVRLAIDKAEKLAWCVQVLLEAVSRGGDQTPPLGSGSETVVEYCMRIHAHHAKIMANGGYDGQWAAPPTNDQPLKSQQIIDI